MGGYYTDYEDGHLSPPFSPICLHIAYYDVVSGREGAEQMLSILDITYPRHPAPMLYPIR